MASTKVPTRTLSVTDGSSRWSRWLATPVLPKRHRWSMSRCQLGIVTAWQTRGEMALPMTTHPVRLQSDRPGCQYHKGSIILDDRGYVRFALCFTVDTVGPWVRHAKYAIAKMFVSTKTRDDDGEEPGGGPQALKEQVIRKTYAYGITAIDNQLWYHGIWFSSKGGIPN